MLLSTREFLNNVLIENKQVTRRLLILMNS